MLNLRRLRLPFREDTAFSLLALSVFIIPLIFSQFAYENFESVKFALLLIFAGLSGFLLILRLLKARDPRLKISTVLYWSIAGLLLWGLISVLGAQDKFYAFFGFYYRYTSGLIFLLIFALLLILFCNLLTRDRLEFLLKILTFDGLLAGLFTFFQGFGLIIYPGAGFAGFFRGPGFLGNTNFSAMFMACVLPLAVYLFIQARAFWPKVYYALVVFWLLFGGLIAASRGALLALAVGAVAVLFLTAAFGANRKFFWKIFIGAILALAMAALLLQTIRPNYVSGILSNTDANASSRIYAWRVSWNIIKQHPWFGAGLGNFAPAFERAQLPDLAAQYGVFDDAHNWPLQMAVTGGVPYLLLFLALMFLPAIWALRRLKRVFSWLDTALLTSLVIWFAAAGFNPVSIPMYIVLAVLISALALPELREQNLVLPASAKLAFGAAAMLLALFGFITFASEHLLGASARAYSAENYSKAVWLANLSWKINPTNQLALTYRAAGAIGSGQAEDFIIKDISRIINLHPGQANSYIQGANLYGRWYATTKNKRYLELSIEAINQALAIDPFFANRFGQLALDNYLLGDYAAARINLQKALSLDDKNFMGWLLSARLYQLDNNRTASLEALEKAFRLNPLNLRLKYLLYLARRLPDIRAVPLDIAVRQPDI